MSTGSIIAQRQAGVLTLRLSNPGKKNAISAMMWRQLASHAEELRKDGETRVVIIQGDADSGFSAGADIGDFQAQRSGAGNAGSYDDLVEFTCRAVEGIPQPTIAVVEGACIGAGASLACSCDLMLASSHSFFAVPAAKLGLGYDPRGVQRFVRVAGLRVVQELLLTADRVSAARAHELGLVHRLVDARDIEATVAAIAARLKRNAPLTLRAVKLALRATANPQDGALQFEALDAAQRADASSDYEEGRLAFAQRRPPEFKGR